jgi:hypothetical protein
MKPALHLFHNQKSDLHINIFNEHTYKDSQKILANRFNNTSKRSYTITKSISFQGSKDGSTYINP